MEVFRKFNALLDDLQGWHARKVDRSWLRPLQVSRSSLLAIILFSVVATACNSLVRQGQYEAWATNPASTTLNDTVLFSTTDAAYFLKAAEIIESGETFNDHIKLRHFPNAARYIEEKPYTRGLRDFPLLSVVIAAISPDKSTSNLAKVAHWLILVTAAMTALSVILAFGATGYWLEACVAAIGGGLSASYLVRSSAGRIDTDQLNLAFVYLLLGMCVLAAQLKNWRHHLLLCIAIGCVSFVFMWWYDRAQLVWLPVMSLIWMTSLFHRNPFLALAGGAVIIILSGAAIFNPFDSAYLKDTVTQLGFVFPNTYSTITEISSVTVTQMFSQMTGSIEMGLLCILGLGIWTIRHPVIGLAFAPVVLFGFLNFIIGNRAVFYSAPAFWFGGAFLITTLCRFIATKLREEVSQKNIHNKASIFATTIAGLMAWVASPTDYVPRSTFSPSVIAGFQELEQSSKDEQAVIATWWDYGYVATLFSGLPTLHDGGSQTSPVTYFFAHSMLESRQPTSVGVLKSLATDGLAELGKYQMVEQLEFKFDNASSAPSPNLYLALTSQMAGWMGSISKIGNWDIEKGEPVHLSKNTNGPQVQYQPLNCRFNNYPRLLNCQGVRVDLQRGHLNGKPLLVGWTHTKDGSILRSHKFDHNANHAIQIVQNSGRLTAYLLHQQLYKSTFNKLFYQGLIEHPSITLHYDDYPQIRIYRIKGNPGS